MAIDFGYRSAVCYVRKTFALNTIYPSLSVMLGSTLERTQTPDVSKAR